MADAIFPIPPPAPEAGGKCLSKYFDSSSPNAILQSIKNSPYWKDHQDDTIFKQIEDAGKTVSIEICVAKVRERQKGQTDEEVRRNSRSQSRGVVPRSAEAAEMAETLESLERALAEAKAKQAEMIRNRKRVKSRRQSDSHDRPNTKVEEGTKIKFEANSSSPPETLTALEHGNRSIEDINTSQGVAGSPNQTPTVFRGSSHASPIDATNGSHKRLSKDL